MSLKVLCLLWVSLLFISPLHAAERAGYFVMTIGQAVAENEPFKIRSSATKIGGGYQFSDFFSMEIFFTYYGKASDRVGAVELYQEGGAATVQTVGIFPVNNVLRLFAKAGATKAKIKFKLDDPILTVTGDFKGRDVTYGAGFLIDVDHDSTIRLEYEVFDYLDDGEFSVLTVGFQHYF